MVATAEVYDGRRVMPSGPESITSVFGITPLKMPNQVSASSPNLRSSRMFSRHAWTNAGRCVIAVATTAASPVAVTFLDMFGQTYCRPPKVGAGRRGYNCIHGKMAQMKDCEYRGPLHCLSVCSSERNLRQDVPWFRSQGLEIGALQGRCRRNEDGGEKPQRERENAA